MLGLSANTLNTIEANHRGDVTRCLIDTLGAWLKQADQVKERGGPTHHTLIKALKEIGEVATADRIDKEGKGRHKIAKHNMTTAMTSL